MATDQPETNETTTDDERDDEQVIVIDSSDGSIVPDDEHPLPKHGHAGRPPLVIDLKKLHAIASTFASYAEMAAVFNCHPETLRRKYSREIEKGRQMGKISYRQIMRERAKRSDRVLIHMYERHVEAPPAKGDTVIQVVGDNARPLIIREVDEESDTRQ